MVDVSDRMNEIKNYAKDNKMSIQDACALFTAAGRLMLYDVIGCTCNHISGTFDGSGGMSVGIYNEQGRKFAVDSSVAVDNGSRESFDVEVKGNIVVDKDM